MNKAKEAKDRASIQLIQSCCVHRRRDFIPKNGRNVTRCLDCGKILYEKK